MAVYPSALWEQDPMGSNYKWGHSGSKAARRGYSGWRVKRKIRLIFILFFFIFFILQLVWVALSVSAFLMAMESNTSCDLAKYSIQYFFFFWVKGYNIGCIFDETNKKSSVLVFQKIMERQFIVLSPSFLCRFSECNFKQCVTWEKKGTLSPLN